MASHGDLSPEFKKLRETSHQIYLVVYTFTDAVMNEYVCGSGLDLGLNEQGMDDARKLARRFQRNPLKIKKIISSPELRCIQWSDFLHDEMKGKILIFRELSDQFMGELEGKKSTSLQAEKNPPQGESLGQFSARVYNGLVRVLQEKDLSLVSTHLRVAQKIFDFIGLGAEKIEPGVLYVIDLPAGGGIAHYRQI